MDEVSFLSAATFRGVPGLIHGFGLRLAGPRAQARERVRTLFRTLGEVFFLKQVHGCEVARPPWADPPEADASLTGDPGGLLAIETADCLPVLLVDPVERRVAAAHAGWRGTAAGVVRKTLREFGRKGSPPERLIAALGPSIGVCCYEVGPEVEDAFGPPNAPFFRLGSGGRKHLDLKAANRAQLIEGGVRENQIDNVDLCTCCRKDLFFSYRRDGAQAGRMISVVGFAATAFGLKSSGLSSQARQKYQAATDP